MGAIKRFGLEDRIKAWKQITLHERYIPCNGERKMNGKKKKIEKKNW